MSEPSELDLNLSLEIFQSGQGICLASAENCVNYHYLRPLLRRIGAVTSSFTLADFYKTQISEVLSDSNQTSLLISGTADYSWLLAGSPLISSSLDCPKTPVITVVDKCETPLIGSKAAAKGLTGMAVSTDAHDVRQGLTQTAQDVIVTDAFLTQFSDRKDRMMILNNWRQALRFGGVAITTAQVRAKSGGDNQSEGQAFRRNTTALFSQSEYPDLLNISEETFRVMIYRHCLSLQSRAYEGEDEINEEISESGLKILDMQNLKYFSLASERSLSYRGLVLQKVH